MLVRIVHMTFHPEQVEAFRALFEQTAPQIRAFPGCRHLELWQQADEASRFTTYSLWENQAALDSYRASTLFRSTWTKTRQWFAAPPTALSFCSLMRV